jgi:hypothetical protein
MERYKLNFVLASIFGSILVGSINHQFRMYGFALCVIGNIYWMWYHKCITEDKEMLIVFVAYFIINTAAIINNYYNGVIAW